VIPSIPIDAAIVFGAAAILAALITLRAVPPTADRSAVPPSEATVIVAEPARSLPGQLALQARRRIVAGVRTLPRSGDRNSLALLGLATAVGGYWVLRYAGRWTETDSGLMAQAIRLVAESTQLDPNVLGVYSNGFGYQAVSLAITAFTGLDIETLQQVVYPIISALLVLPAWALYRELTGSGRAATIATLLLLLVPEHLFAVLRGSHERLDRAFLLTALWLLVRSTRFAGDPGRAVIHTATIVLLAYSLVATNALFGISFVAALATAFVLSLIAYRGPVNVRAFARRSAPMFRWASAAAAVVVVVFMVFMYPPFGISMRLLLDIPGRLLALLLGGGGGFDPYAYVQTAWLSPVVFLFLSAMNIFLAVASLLIWLWLGIAWLRGGRPNSYGIWVLWLLYAAFAFQGVASIASDQTGALSGNVQIRAFSVFATVAAPLVAVMLSRWRPGPIARKVASAVAGVAIIAALTKTTLDPALSNKWIFYAENELQALRWADDQQLDALIWVGPEDRVAAAFTMEVGHPDRSYRLQAYEPPADVEAVLISELIVTQSERLGITVPPVDSKNRLYDNGEVQLYR
jgi:hypothetical protein